MKMERKITDRIREKTAEILIKLAEKIVWKKICAIYWRLYDYTKRIDLSECPFCNVKESVENFMKWKIVKNQFPYMNATDHLLIIPIKHKTTYWELSVEEWIELKRILEKYTNKWYKILWRVYWKTDDASVEHLHIHLIK